MAVDFSVVIPTFRRVDQLRECIASVIAQPGVTTEIFVIDDSAEGSAQQVVECFADARISYVKNPQPTGGRPSVVRNLGWPLATGRFVHFLDDDDLVVDGHYAAVKSAFESHPDVGQVFGRIEPFGSGLKAQLDHECRYFADAAHKAVACARFGTRWAYTATMLFDSALLVCSASIIRRACVGALQGFDPEIRLMEDADFHVRVMREFGVHFLNRTAIRYRIGSPSLMHSPNPPPSQRQEEISACRRMQAKYRNQRGLLEYYALAIFTRVVLKML
ncbi:MAG TPA: glycosyltransferase [Steroidobacteraceae bacterium]|nr:glycosyltransferase [Steroidobacteraceae bacterium]